MNPIERILLPVDFSRHTDSSVKLAVALAGRFRAQVQVLHVDPMPGAGTVAVEPVYIAPQLLAGLQAELDARTDQKLGELRDEIAAAGVSVDTERRRGNAVSGIVACAEDWGASLIIMGSQGISGIPQLLLGSTADKVSRVAPCPVLISGRADDTRKDARTFERVLAATDYSQFSEPVARLAAQVTSPGGTLELVHIWNEPYISALNVGLGGERDLRELIAAGRAAEAQRIQQFAAGLNLASVHVTNYVEGGTPAIGILNRAEETQADLIVLGAHSRASLTERILGTVADRVLRHAEVPVLVYPERALPQGA